MGGNNDFNVQAMITRLMWTIWTSLSAVRERPLNLITHSLTGRRQAIPWIDARILLNGPLWTNFNEIVIKIHSFSQKNKANLRDLIAATGLVILLKLDLNPRFFSRCDLEIWWMTQKNNRAPLLCHFELFASFRSHCMVNTNWSYSPETPNLGQNRCFL